MNRTLLTRVPSDPLPFDAATENQRVKALASIRRLLEWQFPLLSDELLADLFSKYEPMLWVDRETQEMHVDDGDLERFANWIDLNLNVGNPLLVSLYGQEAHYLAKKLVYYTERAQEILRDDPELTKPESIGLAQFMLHQLAAGNSVAEKAYQAQEWSGKQPITGAKSARDAGASGHWPLPL